MTYSWPWSTVSLLWVGLARASNVGCPTLLQASPQPLGEQQQGPPARLSRVCTPRPAPRCNYGKPQQWCREEPGFKARAKMPFLAIWAKLPLGAGTSLIAQYRIFITFRGREQRIDWITSISTLKVLYSLAVMLCPTLLELQCLGSHPVLKVNFFKVQGNVWVWFQSRRTQT